MIGGPMGPRGGSGATDLSQISFDGAPYGYPSVTNAQEALEVWLGWVAQFSGQVLLEVPFALGIDDVVANIPGAYADRGAVVADLDAAGELVLFSADTPVIGPNGLVFENAGANLLDNTATAMGLTENKDSDGDPSTIVVSSTADGFSSRPAGVPANLRRTHTSAWSSSSRYNFETAQEPDDIYFSALVPRLPSLPADDQYVPSFALSLGATNGWVGQLAVHPVAGNVLYGSGSGYFEDEKTKRWCFQRGASYAMLAVTGKILGDVTNPAKVTANVSELKITSSGGFVRDIISSDPGKGDSNVVGTAQTYDWMLMNGMVNQDRPRSTVVGAATRAADSLSWAKDIGADHTSHLKLMEQQSQNIMTREMVLQSSNGVVTAYEWITGAWVQAGDLTDVPLVVTHMGGTTTLGVNPAYTAYKTVRVEVERLRVMSGIVDTADITPMI